MLWLDAFIFYTFEILKLLSSSLRTSSTTSPTTWGRAMTPRYLHRFIDYDPEVLSDRLWYANKDIAETLHTPKWSCIVKSKEICHWPSCGQTKVIFWAISLKNLRWAESRCAFASRWLPIARVKPKFLIGQPIWDQKVSSNLWHNLR